MRLRSWWIRVNACVLCVACFGALAQGSYGADARKIVTAAQVNGTWRANGNEFKVWALGKQRLQVEFFGTYEYETAYGPSANIGEGSGIAFIEGDTAIFRPDGAEDECQIAMRFTGGKLVVEQEGVCLFGQNVTAAGTYRKVSSKKPRFGEP